MNDLMPLLAALGGAGGLATFGALIVRAFLQALRATAEVSAEKNTTITRQANEIEAKDRAIESRDKRIDQLQAESSAKDLKILALELRLAPRRDP